MAPVPEAAFRDLLADCSRPAFVDFVAALWRARGREVRRDGDRLHVDGRELWPVRSVDGGSTRGDVVPVAATEPPADAADAVVGPTDLRRVLLYGVPRERAADLFESHFDRPLDDDWSELTAPAGSADGDAPDGSGEPPTGASDGSPAATPDGTGGGATGSGEDPDADGSPPAAGPTRQEGTVERRQGSVARRVGRATASVPRYLGDLRRLLGEPRGQAAAVGALVLLAAGGWALVGYQPAPAATSAPPFAVGEPPAPENASYRVAGAVHAVEDGERFSLGETRTYDPGPPFVVVDRFIAGDPGDRTTIVRYRLVHVAYERQSWTNESRYRRYAQRFGPLPNTVRTSDSTRTVYRVGHRRGLGSQAPSSRFAAWTLAGLAYERRGTGTYEGRDVVRYVPVRGWTTRNLGPRNGIRSFRVRAASGEVLVDAETGALLSADVAATVVPAETWADVLLDPDRRLRVRYRVDLDVRRPEPPPWVREIARTATAENTTGG